MAENNNRSIFIIQAQGGYDSIDLGSGQEVTQDEYSAWADDNAVTALDGNGDIVDIVGGNDKISVTDGTTTVGYNDIQQPSTGAGFISYSTTVSQAVAISGLKLRVVLLYTTFPFLSTFLKVDNS